MDAKQALQVQYACKHGAASYGVMAHGMQTPQPPPNVIVPQGPIGSPGSGAIYAGTQLQNSSTNMANTLASLRARQAAQDDFNDCMLMNGFVVVEPK
jgi:hypothetical protein